MKRSNRPAAGRPEVVPLQGLRQPAADPPTRPAGAGPGSGPHREHPTGGRGGSGGRSGPSGHRPAGTDGQAGRSGEGGVGAGIFGGEGWGGEDPPSCLGESQVNPGGRSAVGMRLDIHRWHGLPREPDHVQSGIRRCTIQHQQAKNQQSAQERPWNSQRRTWHAVQGPGFCLVADTERAGDKGRIGRKRLPVRPCPRCHG